MKKVALITGSSGSIGSSLCKVYYENGYEVFGIDINSNKSCNYCKKVFQVDLNKLCVDQKYKKSIFDSLCEHIKKLNVLINNAAIQILGSMDQIKDIEWVHTMNVNLNAPFFLSKWAAPLLSESKGCIINIASIHANLTKPQFVAYSTSKSGLIGLTKSMAVSFKGKIRVNVISPAAINTDMLKSGFKDYKTAIIKLNNIHPVNRIGQPSEVADIAFFLSGPKAEFINGSNITLDGGISSVLKDI